MAGTVTDIQTITFDDLEQLPSVGPNDLLLVRDENGNIVKKATQSAFIIGERDERVASDGYLQGQIDTLAGTSGQFEKANLSLKGAPNGLAELDSNGKVPASQLPSFVDDVIEGYYKEADGKFYLHYDSSTDIYSDEVTPETGKVYTDLRTNLTYRWGGSAYVKIASDLALGETASTAYRGDRGKAAYDHSLIRGTGTESATNPHGLSSADIGLGNVPNVTTNNQTPTYTEASANAELTSGETLSTAFGKLAKIVKSFIAHIADTANPHSVTKTQVGLGNVTNVATESVITSGSSNNITSGAVYTGLAGKLDSNGTAANSQYAQAIGTSISHPAIGSNKLPVYIDANGEPKAITSLEIGTIQGDTTVTGKLTAQDDVTVNGSLDVKDNSVFEKNVSIIGNLSVSGVTTVAEQESAISSDYLITRLNQTSGLAQGSHSGIAVNNYQNGKMATISADHEGTWRVADSATDTATVYTNIALFDSTYYTGLTHTETTGPTHIITNKQSLTLDNTVWYNGYYYYYDGSDWKQIQSVTDGAFVFSAPITDTGLIETLDALIRLTLLYYITVTDNYIDEQQNQPLLTRAEVTDLGNNHLLKWDSVHKKAVSAGAIADTVASGNMQPVTSNAVFNLNSTNVIYNYSTEPRDVFSLLSNCANRRISFIQIGGTNLTNSPDDTSGNVFNYVVFKTESYLSVTAYDLNSNNVYQNSCRNGTWRSWEKVTDERNLKYFQLPYNTDLNNVTAKGVYTINTGVNFHAPYDGWHQLIVIPIAETTNYTMQIDYSQTDRMYIRSGGWNGTQIQWTNWKETPQAFSITITPSVTPTSLSQAIADMLNVLQVENFSVGSYIIYCNYGTYFEVNMTITHRGVVILVRGSTLGWDGVSARDDHLFTASKYTGEDWVRKIY